MHEKDFKLHKSGLLETYILVSYGATETELAVAEPIWIKGTIDMRHVIRVTLDHQEEQRDKTVECSYLDLSHNVGCTVRIKYEVMVDLWSKFVTQNKQFFFN